MKRSVKLSRVEFWQLHKRVFIRCFEKDFMAAYDENPSFTKLYGYTATGKQYPSSIWRKVKDEINFKQLFIRRFHELRVAYDEGSEELEIPTNLLRTLLAFLGIKQEDLKVSEEAPLKIYDFETESDQGFKDEFDARLKDIAETQWYFYYKDKDANQNEEIHRAHLLIKKPTSGKSGNLAVELKTPGGKNYSDFLGYVNPHSTWTVPLS